MRKISLISLMFAFALFLAACGTSNDSPEDNNASDSDSAGDGEVYSVGIDVTYPPFEYQEGGDYKGIDIDLIHAIAEDQGFEIELEAMDFGGIIPAMQAGQLDIAIAGMSITDERKEIVDFSEPYFEAGITLVVNENNDTITRVEDLEGQTVAVKNGTSGAKWAEDNKGDYGFDTIQVSDSTSMFQEVTNGTADALIEDYPVIAYAIATDDLNLKIVGDRLNGDFYGIAVLKGENGELLQKINDGLANLRENGEYDEIINTYIEQ
ncbi:transporter substrate-binding domain-containing protein [Oceanobacillus polygoni]|uniref:Polar amino acid transport system substrate-binding protein n=1 Tax=Oceanobacillus polygoni TaxID=1235259 RepID=A0A9X1CEU3_9BACI|nr:transporter substrate-binding domain-containing protein [Oceanobacillus polygoni]MBP2076407.1 polar amino acid transport system substrate-binding protein [Oceanobacillus polygoni]